MAEEKSVSRPMQLWSSALKAVKGDSTAQLVEEFTAEMTLVAEGLCEDQARLRQAVEELRREQDRGVQRAASEVQAIETSLRENQRDTDRRLDEMEKRLQAIENRQNTRTRREAGVIRQLTWLACIVCGSWVLVTILNLLK